MKVVFYILIIFISITGFSQTEDGGMIFHSRKELNQYRFSNSDLSFNTSGFLLDMEEEWSSNAIDSFFIYQQNDSSNVDFLLGFLNLLEQTDVTYQFERDSLLFPILDHYMSIKNGRKVLIPLFITDIEFNRLIPSKRLLIDNWSSQESYPQFIEGDFTSKSSNCAAFFADTITHNDVAIYWDESTYITNTATTISKVLVSFGSEWIQIQKGEIFDINQYLNPQINAISVKIHFSDSTIFQNTNIIHIKNKDENSAVPREGFADFQMEFYHWDNLELLASVHYGCEDGILNKPFILVAGWGPYTDKPTINSNQGWPSDEEELYHLWNQAGFLDNLQAVGYDVIIARFLPPNADIRKNADLIEEMINHINSIKMANGSYEENVILGYSAGAMAVRLALEKMEHRHLNYDGPNPHTKLYISYDGEHGGANIPLAAQHCVEYLDEYLPYYNYDLVGGILAGYTIYTLHYILTAPLSKQLLKYFYTETGTEQNPGQGEHIARTEYMWEYSYHNHAKNTHLPNYPSFTRNISISNGMNESAINDSYSGHHPYPNFEGHIPFLQFNNNRTWSSAFNVSGGNNVFKYRFKPLFSSWETLIDATTNNQCLVLDNAPGGTVFIPKKQNPLWSILDMMKRAIVIGDPNVFKEHTQFCFTPTLLTHDIRNFNPATTNYRMEYSMKQNKLMFQSKLDYETYLLDPNAYEDYSDYWGYPHLAYPNSHYWEVSPFDAVFSWSQNTEHILFNTAYRDDPNNFDSEWVRVFSSTSGIVKNFILDESDYYNAFIQNKQYGWNARDNYTYKAEVIVPNAIFVGKEVTQRTDFKEAEFLANSDITLRAGEEIHLMPGTNIISGSNFHAFIEPPSYDCDFFKSGNINPSGPRSTSLENESNVEVYTIPENTHDDPFIIYPNPSDGLINIRNKTNKSRNFKYSIYDFNGTEILSGESDEVITYFRAQTGIYILKIQDYENTYNYKVIIR